MAGRHTLSYTHRHTTPSIGCAYSSVLDKFHIKMAGLPYLWLHLTALSRSGSRFPAVFLHPRDELLRELIRSTITPPGAHFANHVQQLLQHTCTSRSLPNLDRSCSSCVNLLGMRLAVTALQFVHVNIRFRCLPPFYLR